MNNNLLIPLKKEAEGKAKQILKGAGLALLKPKFFNIDLERVGKENLSYEQAEQIGYDKIGVLGLPVWDTVTLISPAYVRDDGLSVPIQRITFDIALLEINNSKNIVKTSIAGRNGTIKEYMSDSDMDVTIKGSLFSELDNTPPINELKTFKSICSAPSSIKVESNLLLLFDVFDLVIEAPYIKQRQGQRNIIDFELKCCSDIPFELQINNA